MFGFGRKGTDPVPRASHEDEDAKVLSRRRLLGIGASVAAAAVLSACGADVKAAPAPQPTATAEQTPSGTPSASESQSPSPAETSSTPAELSLSMLDDQTFQEFSENLPAGAEGDKMYDGMIKLIVDQVNIPTSEWKALSKSERARATELYIQTVMYVRATDLGDTSGETPAALEELGFTPVVDESFVESLKTAVGSDGELTDDGLKALEQLEMLRRASEMAVGLANDENNDAQSEIKENLSSVVLGYADKDKVSRLDFTSEDLTKFDVTKIKSKAGAPAIMYLDRGDGELLFSYPNPDAIRTQGDYGEGSPRILAVAQKAGDGEILMHFGYQ